MTMKKRRDYAPTHAVRTILTNEGARKLDEIRDTALRLQPDLSPHFIDRVIRRGLRGDKAWLHQLEDGRIAIKGAA